jgi:hypothetical protein
VADDAGVVQQPGHVGRTEAGHGGHVEAGEGPPEGVPLAQDREPRQPGLEALEAQLLEQAGVVDDRSAPLLVVVPPVLGRLDAPGAPDQAVVVGGRGRGVGHGRGGPAGPGRPVVARNPVSPGGRSRSP